MIESKNTQGPKTPELSPEDNAYNLPSTSSYSVSAISKSGAQFSSIFISDILKAINPETSYVEEHKEKEKEKLQDGAWRAILFNQERQIVANAAAADAERRAEENRRRLRDLRHQQEMERREHQQQIQSARAPDKPEPHKPSPAHISSTFKKEAGILDTVSSTYEGAKKTVSEAAETVTKTYKAAHHAAGDAIESGANAVGLDGKTVRQAARTGETVLAKTFNAVTDPVGTGIALGKAAAPVVADTVKSGANWVASTAAKYYPF